jgi:agmatine deiminase
MKNNEGFYFPAEFEKHQAIWMGWPVDQEKMRGLSLIPVFIEMIKALTMEAKVIVKIAVQNEGEKSEVDKLLRGFGIPKDYYLLYCVPHVDIWFRDMGPIFLKSNLNQFRVVQFNFNNWSYESKDSPDSLTEKNVSLLVAKELRLDVIETSHIGEGGNREFNGKGLMMVVEAVEFERNPGKSREEIETEYKRIFNIKKMIWLKKGVYEDDSAFSNLMPGPDGLKNIWHTLTTGGHIDECCRFIAPDTILLARVTPEEAERCEIARENYKRLEENYEILKQATDQDDKPFKIKRICVPEPLYVTMSEGDSVYDHLSHLYKYGSPFPLTEEIKIMPASSYLNFLVTNNLVLMPYYWKPGLPEIIRQKDIEAQATLTELFPNRKIHPIDAMAINVGGGGMHCITQQEPV